jgi:hypothetical protein
MRHETKYLVFGLLVLASYWYTVRNGIVFFSYDQSPSAPVLSTGGFGRTHSSSWGGGFQGGK